MTVRAAARLAGVAAVAVGVVLLAWAWTARDTTARQGVVLSELEAVAEDTEPTTPQTITPPAIDAPDNFPAIVDSAVRDPETNSLPVGAVLEIIEEIPHDTGAFTQGLELFDGRLFESTGLVGESTLREVDPDSGEVLRSVDVEDVFAEGLTIVDDTAIQLTWLDNEAYRYDLETFDLLATYTYEGQGWGLCDLGDRLVMSDGSPTLQFRDRDTFALVSTIDVEFNNSPVEELNELECVNGRVWSNIWQSSLIIEIDPATGKVTTVLNARSLTPTSAEGSTSKVLNGIAYDPTNDTFLLTGKQWPTMYRVRIMAAADAAIG